MAKKNKKKNKNKKAKGETFEAFNLSFPVLKAIKVKGFS
jgi:hypothetical protein